MTIATAFSAERILAAGPLYEIALAAREAVDKGRQVLVIDDATGKIIDLDLRGSAGEIAERYRPDDTATEISAPQKRGRPKLGVVAREVTLLPRHWDWLNAQKGGASAALRRLVEEARKADGGRTAARRRRERAYAAMATLAGDRPNFEEASRALFAGEARRLALLTADWPADIANYVYRLFEEEA